MDPIATLQSCFAIAKYVHDKREELRTAGEGVVKLCEKIDRLLPAIEVVLAQPAKIASKGSVLAALEHLLQECKAFVDAYSHRGMFGRLKGVVTGKDSKTIDALNTELHQLLVEFLAINAADSAASREGAGGKFGAVSLRRAKWADISFPTDTKPKSGASADVYRARWDHKDCAVKIIKPNQSLDLRGVYRELEIIAELSHKNIVQTYAICEDLGPKYGPVAIVMEYAARGDLQTFLEGDVRRQLTFQHLASIALDICSAMKYCAQRRVAHRDLKSKNVLVTDTCEAKLCDFGLSKFVESGKTQLTIGGEGLGTPEYSAPEVLRGNREEKFLFCDIYSFGCILHEMITRQRPWSGKTAVQVIAAVISGQGLPIPQGLDADVHTALAGALSHTERDRPSFEELYSLLKRCYETKASFFAEAGGGGARPPPPPRPSASPRTAEVWFYSDGGAQSAAQSKESMARLFARREVVFEDTPVWTAGLAEWLPLRESPLWADCQASDTSSHPSPPSPSLPPPPPKTPSAEQRHAEERLRREREALELEERQAAEAQAQLEMTKAARRMSLERHELEKKKQELRRVKEQAEEETRRIQQGAAEARARELAASYVPEAKALTTAEQVSAFARDGSKMREEGAVAVVLEKIKVLAIDDKNRTALGAAGACEAVVAALRTHAGSAAVAEKGCGAVRNLAGNNAGNKAKLGAAGACEAVVAALRTHAGSAAVAEMGCMAVTNLAGNNAGNKAKLGAVGARAECRAVLERMGMSEEAKRVATGALGLL